MRVNLSKKSDMLWGRPGLQTDHGFPGESVQTPEGASYLWANDNEICYHLQHFQYNHAIDVA